LPGPFACGVFQVFNCSSLQHRRFEAAALSGYLRGYPYRQTAYYRSGPGVGDASGQTPINALRSLQQHSTPTCSVQDVPKRSNTTLYLLPAPISRGILLQINMRLPARRRGLFAAQTPSSLNRSSRLPRQSVSIASGQSLRNLQKIIIGSAPNVSRARALRDLGLFYRSLSVTFLSRFVAPTQPIKLTADL
jgi:hypothetical protein